MLMHDELLRRRNPFPSYGSWRGWLIVAVFSTMVSFTQAAPLTFEGVGTSSGAGTGSWGPNAPLFGTVTEDRWNIGSTTANTTFTYDSALTTTIDLNLSTDNRGIVIGSGNLAGSTATLNITAGEIIVIEDGTNAGVSVGVPASGGDHSGVLTLNGGNLTINERTPTPANNHSELNLNFRGSNPQSAVLNLQGGSVLTVDEIEHVHDGFAGSARDVTTTFNWLDGTWVGSRIVHGDATDAEPSTINVIVDGGTWRVRNDSDGSTGGANNFIDSDIDSFVLNGLFTVDTDGNNASLDADASGVGGILKTGEGLLGMLNAKSYDGNTTVDQGVLFVRNDAGLGSTVGNTLVTGTGSLRVNFDRTLAEDIVFDTTSATDATLLKDGTGVWTQTGGVLLNSDVQFSVNDVSSLDIEGTFAGAGALNKTGLGQMLFNVATPYSAAVTVSEGSLGGSGSIDSDVTVLTGAALAPGDGAVGAFGVETADVDGSINIEFDGSSIDLLNVDGLLDLTNGEISFTELGAISGASLVFGSYGSLLGSGSVSLTGVPTGYAVDFNFGSANQLALVQSSVSLIGDYNGDGMVDSGDYAFWRNNLGQPGSVLDNRDPANSGVVGADDLASWTANFGAGSPGAIAASVAVPEPSSLAGMLLLGSLVGCCRHRGDR